MFELLPVMFYFICNTAVAQSRDISNF